MWEGVISKLRQRTSKAKEIIRDHLVYSVLRIQHGLQSKRDMVYVYGTMFLN